MSELNHALSELKLLANPGASEIYINFGLEPQGEYWGCPITKMKELGKKLKKNHELSLQLWDAGIHDAKLLACFIEEPKKVSWQQLLQQLPDTKTQDLAMRWAECMVSPSAFALNFIKEYKKSDEPYFRAVSFHTLKNVLKAGKNLPDDGLLQDCLAQIAAEIQNEFNWTKEAMNYALMYFGTVSDNWRLKAINAAHTIGKVEVDYGDTSCVTMDALSFLQRQK